MPMFDFRVTLGFDGGATMEFRVQTQAGNKRAAADQVAILLDASFRDDVIIEDQVYLGVVKNMPTHADTTKCYACDEPATGTCSHVNPEQPRPACDRHRDDNLLYCANCGKQTARLYYVGKGSETFSKPYRARVRLKGKQRPTDTCETCARAQAVNRNIAARDPKLAKTISKGRG